MEKTITTYYATVQELQGKEYKVEILEDGPIKKVAVNGKIYEVDYNRGGDDIHSIIIGHKSYGVQISAKDTRSYEVMNRQDSFQISVMSELDRQQPKDIRTNVVGKQVIQAPMSGVILKTFVSPGDEVEQGSPLCILMAMKMENEIRAESAGKVSEVFVKEGDKVNFNDKLLVIY
jgi:biotin carboxyl carrier protein